MDGWNGRLVIIRFGDEGGCKGPRELADVQGSAKEWYLGNVIPASWPPLAAGAEFTQSWDNSLADPCTLISIGYTISVRFVNGCLVKMLT